jgi:ABC-2 type transport system ATP-binding protein
MDTVIETRDLTKHYGGRPALVGLDLDVPRGSVFGLLGRNGAGKTTAIRCLAGLLTPTRGTARVLGGDPRDGDRDRMGRIGYVSESMEIPAWMTVGEALRFCHRLSPRFDGAYADRLLRQLDLIPLAPIGTLSAGQRRKVGLLLALAPRPELLILDEPAASLDTVVRREFIEQAVTLLTDAGTTIFYSSHILSDVERIASHVGILSAGRLMLSRPLDDLLDSARRVRIRAPGGAPPDVSVPGTVRSRRIGGELLLTVTDWTEDRLDALPEGVSGEVMRIGLEDLFIDLVREEVAA